MKKIIIVASVAIFALASCKKDYTCECTTTSGGETQTTSGTLNGKKKDVKKTCEANNVSNAAGSIKCEIK